jgi:hypothetical protein
MITGISGQKTCILRTDEKYYATWHHWAGKGCEHSTMRMNYLKIVTNFDSVYF